MKKSYTNAVLDQPLVKRDLIPIQNQINTLTEDVSGLKNDVSTLKEDVDNLKKDVNTLKEDVSNLKKDVSIIKLTLVSHDQRLGRMEKDISELKSGFNEMKDDIAKVLSFLYEHFPIQQHQVTKHSEQIDDHEIRIVRVEGQLHIQ